MKNNRQQNHSDPALFLSLGNQLLLPSLNILLSYIR